MSSDGRSKMVTGIIFSVITVIAAGSVIRFSVDPLPLRIALWYAAGTVIIGLYMVLLGLFGVPYTPLTVSLPFALCLLFKLPDLFRWLKEIKLPAVEFDPIFACAVILLSSAALALAVSNMFLPIFRADAIGSWIFKAKMFFYARHIPYDLLRSSVFVNTADYPVLVPLNLAWACICAGRWSEAAARTFFSLQYITGAVIFYYFLKERAGKNIAVFGALTVFILPTLLTNAETGYADFSLAYYVMIAAIFIYRWLAGKDDLDLFISALFMGGACLTKNDGIGIFIAMLATLAISRRWLAVIKYALISSVIFLPYKILTVYYGIKSHMVPAGLPLSNLSRIPALLGSIGTELFNNAYDWLYFWLILFILIILNAGKMKEGRTRFLLIFVILSVLIYFSVYLIVPQKVFFFAGVTMNRLLLGLAPAFAFTIYSAVFGGENDDAAQ